LETATTPEENIDQEHDDPKKVDEILEGFAFIILI
jgi:hypothetical protein